VLREQGKARVADQSKGFDWKTEEDAFMDGYHGREHRDNALSNNDAEGSSQHQFCADCTIATPGYDFQEGQVDGLKTLDPNRPIREADMRRCIFPLSSNALRPNTA
jgi:arsenite oxidase large subunit